MIPDPARTQKTGELNWSLMTFHLDFTWTIVIIIIISSHKHICRDHVDLIKHKSNSVTVRIQNKIRLIQYIFRVSNILYPLAKIPSDKLSPSLSQTIITRHNLDRDDYWVTKASAPAYYRHIELSVSQVTNDQEQDVWT